MSTATPSIVRSLAWALAALALAAGAAQAQGQRGGGSGGHAAQAGGSGGHLHGGGGHRVAPRWGHARFWPYWGIGLGGYYYGAPWYPAWPGYVVVDPPVVDAGPQPVPLQPLIYPRNGQDAALIDADSNACSEWAGQQPNATADASVFRRAIGTCMDARGYTLR